MHHLEVRQTNVSSKKRRSKRGPFRGDKYGEATTQIDYLSKNEHELIWSWNKEVPQAIDQCIHHLVEEQVERRPNAVAICAWDGELTYKELDALASQPSQKHTKLGVGRETIVLLCFEKSKWTVVAMLAVLKAGGPFVALDLSQAADRRLRILEQTGATGILASELTSDILTVLGRTVQSVGPNNMNDLIEEGENGVAYNHDLGTAAYVIFTSGSTGRPKGVVVEHRAVCSSCTYHGQAVGFNVDSRAIQFSSYAFDA